MTMQYLIQLNIWIIIIYILIIINVLKTINMDKIVYRIQKHYMAVQNTYNILYINIVFIYYNIKNLDLYIYINKKQKFIFKLQDRLITFFSLFSIALKKYVFYNIKCGFVLYFLNTYLNIDIITYFYAMNFFICFIIILILMIKLCHQKGWFKNKVLKFMLYLLLWINVAILLYVFVIMINHIFVFIMTKLWNIKNIIKTGLSNKNSNPNDPDLNLYFSDSKIKRKKNRYLQQKAQEMRDKLLFQQQYTTKQNVNSCQNSLSAKRGIDKIIYIEPRQNIDLETQLERIKNELEAYNIQQKKFKLWSKGKGADFTYPDEAKELFKEYCRVLKDLRPSLKSMKKKIEKQLKK